MDVFVSGTRVYRDQEVRGIIDPPLPTVIARGGPIKIRNKKAIIKRCKISIPILSINYASSKRCLRELAYMAECHRTEGQLVFPIFYYVDPSDVRHQRGSFQEAFRQHKKNSDEKIVQQWKEALRKVGELNGWELKKETEG